MPRHVDGKSSFKVVTTKVRTDILRDLRVTHEELEAQGATKEETKLAYMHDLLAKAERENMLNSEFPRAVEYARRYGYRSKVV